MRWRTRNGRARIKQRFVASASGMPGERRLVKCCLRLEGRGFTRATHRFENFPNSNADRYSASAEAALHGKIKYAFCYFNPSTR
jgi:hypothetical protein